ncbi:hypothetical protein Dda_8831 [Drechslerella dactyloides]|uniref:Rhodopsin domain-containing protein n=1 Tax=Drechslerella dactyloides TaxID=74499 RepID=A0AAD6IQ66_DREDA|nr:hypothetical protein Dda_8831 [Drechslerella dactyloides]
MASLAFAMTSQQMSFRDDGSGVFGGFAIKDIIYTHVFLGFTAARQHDNPMSSVVASFANFLSQNQGNLTNAQVAEALGAENVRRVQDMSVGGFYPDEFARAVTAACAAALPALEHETGTGCVGTVFGIMAAVAVVAVGLRVWSREVLASRLMIDDWFLIVGFLLSVAYGIIAIVHANLLLPAVAVWDMSWNTYSQTQMYQTILSLIYPAPLFFIKTSLLLFYLRLCPSYPSEARSVFRTSIFVTFFFILTTSCVSFFVVLLQCDRIAYWEEEVVTACKLDARMVLVAIGAVGVVTDLILWLMPLPLVWRLDLGKREKFLAIITFGLGALACVVSAFRLRAIQMFGYLRDGKELSTSVSVLSIIELYLAIICSSAPAIRALILHYAPRILNVYSPSRPRTRSAAIQELKSTATADGEDVEADNSSTYTIQVGLNVRHSEGYPVSPGGGVGMVHGHGGVREKKAFGTLGGIRRLA